MKQFFITIILIWLLSHAVNAQITISNSFFPKENDTLQTSTDLTVSGIIIPKNGINQVFDFTSLNAILINKTYVKKANTGAAFAQLPTADLVENRNGIYYYINTTNKIYEEVGVSGASAAFLGINTTTSIAPSNVLRRAPMAFFDLKSSSTATKVTYPITELSDSLFGSINQYLSLVDSFRIINNATRTDLVDGYGTLKLPIGQYEVLREKRINYADADMEVRLKLTKTWLGIKQLIPTADLPNFLKSFLGKDTTTAYHFYAQNIKEPLAIVTVNNSDNTKATQVVYKNQAKKTTANQEVTTSESAVIVYPNPTSGTLTLNANEKINHIAIFDVLGKNIFSQNADNQIISIDMSQFENGLYILKLNKKMAIKVIKN